MGLFTVEIKNADIAEAYAVAMAEESDMALFVEQAGVIAVVDHVVIALLAGITYSMTLTSFANVTIKNHLTVDSDSDMVTLGTNLLGVPLSMLELNTLGRDHTIYRTMNLIFGDIGIHRVIMVKDLDLHSVESGIDIHRCANTYSVIDTRLIEGKLKAEHKVAIFVGSVDIVTPMGGINGDTPVLNNIGCGVSIHFLSEVPSNSMSKP